MNSGNRSWGRRCPPILNLVEKTIDRLLQPYFMERSLGTGGWSCWSGRGNVISFLLGG